MAHRISQIASALGAEAFGALDLEISGVSEPATAGPQDLALAMDPKYAEGLSAGQAQAAATHGEVLYKPLPGEVVDPKVITADLLVHHYQHLQMMSGKSAQETPQPAGQKWCNKKQSSECRA